MDNKLNGLVIREATIDDINSIAKLLFGLKKQYGSCIEKDFKSFKTNYSNSIAKAIDSKSNHIWLADIGNEVVGFMTYTTRLLLRLGSEVATMEELFIIKEYRRKGIAYSLFNHSIRILKKMGIEHLEVVSSMAHSGQREWGKKINLEWYSNIHRREL